MYNLLMEEQKYIPMHCICLILYDSILTIALLFASMALFLWLSDYE